MGRRLVHTRGQPISFLVLIAGVALGWLSHIRTDHARAEAPGRGPSDTPEAMATPNASPAEARLRADVSFLAADAREGRAPGTKGIEASAGYIADTFRRLGLKSAPGADGYFQEFSLSGSPKLGDPQELVVHGPEGKTLSAELKSEFTPLAVGVSGSLEDTPIVFAGYGISASDRNLGLNYDD
jgi:hypothetical protein